MSTTYFYHTASAVVFARDKFILQAVRSRLYSLGCRDTRFTDSLAGLPDLLEEKAPHLLVVEVNPQHNCADIIRDLRHGDIGDNPFVVVLGLIREAEDGLVRRLVDAGTDDLVMFPADPEGLDLRLDNLIHNRRPFVITSDYIGPDRRANPREDGNRAQPIFITPPNPLKAKVLDRMPDAVLRRKIKEVASRLHADKVRALCQLVARLIDQLVRLDNNGDGASKLAEVCFEQLEEATTFILRRSGKTLYAPRADVCRDLDSGVREMRASLAQGETPDIERLRTLGNEFAVALREASSGKQPTNVDDDDLVVI